MATDSSFDILGLAVTIQRRRGVTTEEAVGRAIALRDGREYGTGPLRVGERDAEPATETVQLHDPRLRIDAFADAIAKAEDLPPDVAQNVAMRRRMFQPQVEQPEPPRISAADHELVMASLQKHGGLSIEDAGNAMVRLANLWGTSTARSLLTGMAKGSLLLRDDGHVTVLKGP